MTEMPDVGKSEPMPDTTPFPPPPRRTPSTPSPNRSRSNRNGKGSTGKLTAFADERREAYKETVGGLLQLFGGGLLAAGQKADAAAILGYGDAVTVAVADLGVENDQIGALLDKLVVAGPYGALITAVAPLGFQIAVNHGLMPAGIMGTMPPDQLVAGVLGQAPEGAESEAREGTPSTDV